MLYVFELKLVTQQNLKNPVALQHSYECGSIALYKTPRFYYSSSDYLVSAVCVQYTLEHIT